MDTGLRDIVAGSLLVLFTGVNELSNMGESGYIIDAISKVGVVAVLYLWVTDLKKQMKEQIDQFTSINKNIVSTFDKETDELRSNYKDIIKELTVINNNQHDRLMKVLIDQNADLKEINKKLK